VRRLQSSLGPINNNKRKITTMYNIIAYNLEFKTNELVAFNVKSKKEALMTANSLETSSKTHSNFKVRFDND
jgi:hypothetical protein